MMKYSRIQILRFLASLVVVLFHCLGTGGKYFVGPSSFSLFRFGDLGVDLFFVISGFIMVITVETREQHPGIFLRRRLERIVPMYWITTLVMFMLMKILYGSSSDAPNLGLLLQSMFYVTWVSGKFPVIYPGWTLEYEMAFYLLVAAAISLTLRRWQLVILGLSSCVTAGLLAREFGLNAPVFLTNPMYLEFVFGIVVAHHILHRPLPLVPCAAAAMVLGWVMLQSSWTENMWRLVVAGLPATFIVLVAATIDQAEAPLSKIGGLFVHLGDASYSIYLVQVISISVFCKGLRAVAPGTPLDAAIVVVAAATLIIAYGLHRAVERPISRFFKNLGYQPQRGLLRTGSS